MGLFDFLGGAATKVTDVATGGIGSVVGGLSDIVSRFKSSDEDKLKAAAQEMEPMILQLQTNLVEAAHPSLFVAGPRPFVLWICGFGLMWQIIVHPLLLWVWAFMAMKGIPPPPLNIEVLNTLLYALLGVGTLRSVDKYNGVATKKVNG